MCGIYGFIGNNDSFKEVKSGLEKLSYRGYDSAGISSINDGQYLLSKVVGHPENLPDLELTSKISIGHTRWATHGVPSSENAHPHISNDGKISLVHNGIIENYYELKKFLLEQNFKFYSETDTEIIPNLIQFYLQNINNLELAILNALKEIKGAYAIVFCHLDFPEQVFVARSGSPIAIGKDSNLNIHISSDINSFSPLVERFIAIEEKKFVTIKLCGNIVIKNLDGKIERVSFEKTQNNNLSYNLGSFSSFLEKEIFEQPIYIRNAISGRVDLNEKIFKLGGVLRAVDKILESEEVIFTGCGSAYYAAKVGSQIFESYTRIRSRAIPAGELKYLNPVINKYTTLISVSQSGETADTLGCIKMAKNHGATNIGIVNVVNSTIAREVDCGIYIRAGEERSVASTKSVLNQILSMIMLAIITASKRSLSAIEYESLVFEISGLPSKIENILLLSESIRTIAEKYKDSKNLLFIGRNLLEPIAKEAALKTKEISYVHAEGYSAAELKHGPLALIDEEMVTIALVNSGPMEDKMLSNIKEIKSRLGKVIAIIDDKVSEEIIKSVDDYIVIPSVTNKILDPILFLIPCQLIAYYIALLNSRSIDRPRNLAKSVTVE